MDAVVNKKRYTYIDLLRIIACFSVIAIHTAVSSEYSNVSEGSVTYWVYLFITLAIRASVPIFFMISGANLLTKDESLKTIWGKRIVRVVVALVAFSAFYYLCDVSIGKEKLNAFRFFKVLLGQGWVIPFWYLYAYIGFLMIIPFLRALVKNLDTSKFVYLLVLYAVFKIVIPIINRYYPNIVINGYIGIDSVASKVFFYPVVGYFLHNRIVIKNKIKTLLPLWILNLVILILSCVYSYYDGVLCIELNETINALTIFLSFKVLMDSNVGNKRADKIIISVGGCTYGIYLLHPMLLERIGPLNSLKLLVEQHNSWMNPMIYDGCYVLFLMLLGYGLTLFMKKLPVINRFI